jgi:hypothetical protein
MSAVFTVQLYVQKSVISDVSSIHSSAVCTEVSNIRCQQYSQFSCVFVEKSVISDFSSILNLAVISDVDSIQNSLLCLNTPSIFTTKRNVCTAK